MIPAPSVVVKVVAVTETKTKGKNGFRYVETMEGNLRSLK